MADVAREGNEIVVKLSTGERILAVHRDVRVPLSAVKSVDVVDAPIRRIQGLKPRNFKVFGGYWPGWFAYGSFFDGAMRQLLFAALDAVARRRADRQPETIRVSRIRLDDVLAGGGTARSGLLRCVRGDPYLLVHRY